MSRYRLKINFYVDQIVSPLNLKNEVPVLVKLTTKDDELKELKNKPEKDEHEKFLKIPKLDNDFYRKKL